MLMDNMLLQFSFDASALTDNQSFTISSADLFKAYCLNKDFRKAIDTGKFVYVEGHVCLGDEKYIIHSDGRVKLTQYALSHMDECCLALIRDIVISRSIRDKNTIPK